MIWRGFFLSALLLFGLILQTGIDRLYLPVVAARTQDSPETDLFKGYAKLCLTTHEFTRITISPRRLQRVAYSASTDGPAKGETRDGVITLSETGPVGGDWWLWLLDSNGQQISEKVPVHTDSDPGLDRCQDLIVTFYSEDEESWPAFFDIAIISSCEPDPEKTWFEGTTFVNGSASNGHRIVFSDSPDGPWLSEPVVSGPLGAEPDQPDGYYRAIISSAPTQGTWYVWVVDETGARISEIAMWTSTGREPGCNRATIDFDSRD